MAKKIERINPDERAPVQLVGDVYNRIAERAEAEERTMGGQVAYMVKTTCAHPLENRAEGHMVVSLVTQATKNKVARVGKGQPFRGFYCSLCGQFISREIPEELSNVLNNPIGTAV